MLDILKKPNGRPRLWIIALMLVTKILVILLLFLVCTSKPDNSLIVMDTIHQRSSIRSFTGEPVSDQQVQALLQAAMAAPSSRNVQPWVFYVLTDREMLKHLAEALPFAGMAAQAPLAIVVCGDTQKGQPNGEQVMNWVMDCSAASQNILLAAHAMGLGAVWTGVYPYQARIDVLRDLLHIPDHIVPLNLIPVGHPAEEPQPKNKWDPDKVIRR